MPLLRLAYATQFLIALMAIFILWSQVGGQDHLDLMPWYVKLVLGAGAAFAVVKATAAAVSTDRAWNAATLRWIGILIAILIACGLVTLWVHKNLENDETDQAGSASLYDPGANAHVIAALETRIPRGVRSRLKDLNSAVNCPWS
ncbi:MAG TPA: hypothetical protein VML19_28170 [Verrucomicrobiae bacterium]|nr:hypothetical protein [Verrucomicrobiae bacterium]